MGLLFGGGMVIVVVWALAVSRIARLAQDRGRIVAGWALGAAVAGVLGGFAGIAIVQRSMGGLGGESLMGMAVLSLAALPLLIFGPMGAIALVLRLAPIRVSHRNDWPVHFVDHGPGRVSIDADVMHLVWAAGSRDVTLDQLRGAEVDGESVRLTYTIGGDEVETVVLPMGKPATPAGRRRQSQALAQRLRTDLPGTRVVAHR